MLYTLFFSRCISRVCNVKLLLLLIIIAIVVVVVVEEVVVEVFVVCDSVSIGLVVVTEPSDVGTFFQLLFRRKCFSGARADVDVSHDASVPVVCVAVCLGKISRKVNKLNKNVRFFIEKRT